jgi:hypothetical protein
MGNIRGKSCNIFLLIWIESLHALFCTLFSHELAILDEVGNISRHSGFSNTSNEEFDQSYHPSKEEIRSTCSSLDIVQCIINFHTLVLVEKNENHQCVLLFNIIC